METISRGLALSYVLQEGVDRSWFSNVLCLNVLQLKVFISFASFFLLENMKQGFGRIRILFQFGQSVESIVLVGNGDFSTRIESTFMQLPSSTCLILYLNMMTDF